MDRTRLIEYQGKKIVLLDYSNLTDEAEALAEIEKSREFMARLPADRSALTLTDGTGARYTAAVLDALKRLASHNKPYVHAGAAVTSSQLHRVVISAVAVFTGRRLPAFPTRAEALDWLVQQ